MSVIKSMSSAPSIRVRSWPPFLECSLVAEEEEEEAEETAIKAAALSNVGGCIAMLFNNEKKMYNYKR